MKPCASPCAKTAGFGALVFGAGIAAGMICPPAALAVIETLILIAFGYLCLFRWQ